MQYTYKNIIYNNKSYLFCFDLLKLKNRNLRADFLSTTYFNFLVCK